MVLRRENLQKAEPRPFIDNMSPMEHTRSSFSIGGPYNMEPLDPINQNRSTRRNEVMQRRPPLVESDYIDASSWTEHEDDTVQLSRRMKSFRLCDEEAVKTCLDQLLTLLQQQALKRLAKAWIKGICPKKQARFPYRSKQQRDGSDMDHPRPAWWPIEVCEFTEPDHIDKKARMALCLHILRLRPTVAQLREWNEDLHAPNTEKLLETHGWTAFLKELTPPCILDGLGKSPEPEEKLKQRQKIMQDMYEIAEKEESYMNGDRDGEDLICWEEYDEALAVLNKKTQTKKRAREGKEGKSTDTGGRRQKRSKRAAAQESQQAKTNLADNLNKINLSEPKSHRSANEKRSDQCAEYSDHMAAARMGKWRCKPLMPNTTRPTPSHIQTTGIPLARPMGFVHPADYNRPSWADYASSSDEESPVTASFCSSQSSQDYKYGQYQMQEAPTAFPGRRNYTFAEPVPRQTTYQVHNVMDVPQPRFDTVPNTPMVSPTKFAHFPESGAWQHQYSTAPEMERCTSQWPFACTPGFASPIPVSQPAALPTNTHYARNPYFEHGGYRSSTPASDIASYNGLPMVQYAEPHLPHGLPTTYHYNFPTPEEHGQHMPFPHPEPTPDANLPPASLPASVVRGFTGTGSGVSGGAWT